MPSSRGKFRIFPRIENYVWLWVKGVRYLRPECGDRTSHLHEWGHYRRCIVEARTVSVQNLLDFHKISWSSLLIYTSPQVSSTSIVPAAPRNQQVSNLIACIFEILKTNWAMDHWDDPLFSLKNLVHVSDQKVVPHHLVLPWFMLLDWAWISAQEKVMRINIGIVIFLMEVIQNFWVVVDMLTLLLLADFSHDILLQRSCQIISVGKIKSLVYLHLLKVVDVSIFLLLVFVVSFVKQRHQLHVFNCVDWVAHYLCDSLAFRHQHDVVAFEKPDET